MSEQIDRGKGMSESTSGRIVTLDGPVPDPELDASGQHKGYWVLTAEERAKGFVRPVRRKYVHAGPPGPKYPLRDLTDEDAERYHKFGYAKFEAYPESESPQVGRYWTQAQLNRVNGGCKGVTSMGEALSETYAAKPDYYGATFCCACGAHFPVGADGEFVWDGTNERVGT